MVIKTNKTFNNKKGFSLIETLAVVSITAFLALGIIFTIRQGQAASALNDAQTVIIRSLEEAQNRALTGIGTQNHGVYIDEKTVTVFEGSTYVTGTGKTFLLPPLTATDQTGKTIIYKRLAGTADANAVITITQALSGAVKKIIVTTAGEITPE